MAPNINRDYDLLKRVLHNPSNDKKHLPILQSLTHQFRRKWMFEVDYTMAAYNEYRAVEKKLLATS